MSAEYPVVAFLQNCWFRPGTNPELIRRYLIDQKFRRIILARSMSGGRLLRAFGEDVYRRIWWDNASKYVADTSPGRGDSDPEHMFKILDQVRPRGVICFGGVANDGMHHLHGLLDLSQRMMANGTFYTPWHAFPHPNARGLRQFQLDEFAREIKSRYL